MSALLVLLSFIMVVNGLNCIPKIDIDKWLNVEDNITYPLTMEPRFIIAYHSLKKVSVHGKNSLNPSFSPSCGTT